MHVMIAYLPHLKILKIINIANERNVAAIFFVFDISAKSSFNHILDLIEFFSYTKIRNPNIPLILVGNKTDINVREVSYEEALEFAKANCLSYFEVSAKTGINVQEMV